VNWCLILLGGVLIKLACYLIRANNSTGGSLSPAIAGTAATK
jgi:hypothetical protein